MNDKKGHAPPEDMGERNHTATQVDFDRFLEQRMPSITISCGSLDSLKQLAKQFDQCWNSRSEKNKEYFKFAVASFLGSLFGHLLCVLVKFL